MRKPRQKGFAVGEKPAAGPDDPQLWLFVRLFERLKFHVRVALVNVCALVSRQLYPDIRRDAGVSESARKRVVQTVKTQLRKLAIPARLDLALVYPGLRHQTRELL